VFAGRLVWKANEIAERLVIAVDTARKHIKNIYSKLDVFTAGGSIKHAEGTVCSKYPIWGMTLPPRQQIP